MIVTRGHRDDMRVLGWAVDTDARYIGMIGSKRKVLSVYQALEREGIPAEKFDHVHAPVGLEIGALTPDEIAISIAAELIAVRRGATGLAHKAVERAHATPVGPLRPPMLAAVILSGGESSRMGSPKALGSLGPGGQTFLEHLLKITRQPEIGCTRIVLGAHTAEISKALSLDPASIVVNPDWKQGQISSIQAAIRSLPAGETDGVMLFLVDHPLISARARGRTHRAVQRVGPADCGAHVSRQARPSRDFCRAAVWRVARRFRRTRERARWSGRTRMKCSRFPPTRKELS